MTFLEQLTDVMVRKCITHTVWAKLSFCMSREHIRTLDI